MEMGGDTFKTVQLGPLALGSQSKNRDNQENCLLLPFQQIIFPIC